MALEGFTYPTDQSGQHFRVGTAHFWLGIAVAVLAAAAAIDWYVSRRRDGVRHRPAIVPALAVLIVVGVAVQGYLGGRMTYDRGVGVASGGELAQTGFGARRLDAALARGESPVQAGRQAFSADGLGCAQCHGDHAQGMRGPALAGGRDLDEFRHVHGKLLFPPKMVSDRDFQAVNAWLRTLRPVRGGG